MSKQLNSIINKLPHATVQPVAVPPSPTTEKSELNVKTPHSVSQYPSKKMARVVAPVPASLKLEIKQYILDNPGETEKSIILKALRTLGFSISDEYIEDLRKKK